MSLRFSVAPDAHLTLFPPLAILALGMAIRLVWVALVPVDPVSDSHAYQVFALTLAREGVYGWTAAEPSAYWAVGTAALVAAGYLLFGETPLVVVGLNLIASLAMIWLSWRIAERLWGASAGRIAMALMAFWPNLIFFTSVLSSELFFLALSLAGVWFWLLRETWSLRDARGLPALLASGLFFAAACYVRPVALLLPVVLWMVTWPQGLRQSARALAGAGVVLAIIYLCALPWSMRNQAVLGADALISTNFGPNLWMGNNPASDGGYMDLPPEVASMSEGARAEYLGAIAKDYMRENPGQTLLRTLKKAVQLHGRETIGVAWNEAAIRALGGDGLLAAAKLVATGWWYSLVLAAGTGIVLLWREGGWRAALFNPAVAIWGYVTLVHAVIVVEDRYHMPASPWIAMLAAVALARLLARDREAPAS
ncbi:ArnT family glycosyltransferase [Pseudogemmobacter sonorensis]|uniref:ArnT family glycosyltransferase n=1 Tax=Pseudogemmobacter sonorensis TaxID=2989681 RepID=UPI003688B253